MGTRSTTQVIGYGEPIATIYRQYDGYPTGHGRELLDFLIGKRIVNGIQGDDNPEEIFNGPGCLAAALVKHLKKRPGGIYLQGHSCHGDEEYAYTIEGDARPLRLRVSAYGEEIFSGLLVDFDPEKLEGSL